MCLPAVLKTKKKWCLWNGYLSCGSQIFIPTISVSYTHLKKLCEQGVLGENDTVVSVVTGNGLKDVANAIKFCGEPMSLPNDLDLLVEEFAKRGIKTK